MGDGKNLMGDGQNVPKFFGGRSGTTDTDRSRDQGDQGPDRDGPRAIRTANGSMVPKVSEIRVAGTV